MSGRGTGSGDEPDVNQRATLLVKAARHVASHLRPPHRARLRRRVRHRRWMLRRAGCGAAMSEPGRCGKHVPGCNCDYHDEDWRRFAAEYGIELPEVDEVCRHHRQQEVRGG